MVYQDGVIVVIGGRIVLKQLGKILGQCIAQHLIGNVLKPFFAVLHVLHPCVIPPAEGNAPGFRRGIRGGAFDVEGAVITVGDYLYGFGIFVQPALFRILFHPAEGAEGDGEVGYVKEHNVFVGDGGTGGGVLEIVAQLFCGCGTEVNGVGGQGGDPLLGKVVSKKASGKAKGHFLIRVIVLVEEHRL